MRGIAPQPSYCYTYSFYKSSYIYVFTKEGAKSFALTALRRVPVPLLPRGKAELERMRQLRVIVPVREPIDLCSAMVVVPKPQYKGSLTFCIAVILPGSGRIPLSSMICPKNFTSVRWHFSALRVRPDSYKQRRTFCRHCLCSS